MEWNSHFSARRRCKSSVGYVIPKRQCSASSDVVWRRLTAVHLDLGYVMCMVIDMRGKHTPDLVSLQKNVCGEYFGTVHVICD